jgi:hypothetical protein
MALQINNLPDPHIHTSFAFAHGHALVHTARGRSPRVDGSRFGLNKLDSNALEINSPFFIKIVTYAFQLKKQMTTAALKKKLVHAINQEEDKEVLEFFFAVLNKKASAKRISKKKYNEALDKVTEEVKSGNTFSHEEIVRELTT